MDLFAYTQIADLGRIAEQNGISVPRCRGYRLMRNEQRVTAAEIEQMINEQALYDASLSLVPCLGTVRSVGRLLTFSSFFGLVLIFH